jgi:hypothetical protein
MNLAYAQQDYFFGMEDINRQQNTANISAASQRQAKPSASGLALGLAGSALSGYSTYTSLKAPKGFNTPQGNSSNVKFKPVAFNIPQLT